VRRPLEQWCFPSSSWIYFKLLCSGIVRISLICVICVGLCVLETRARENSTLVYAEGAARAANGDIEGAIPFFEKAVKLSPDYSLAHYGLGRAYLYRESRMKDAIRELSISVRCDRRLAKGYFYLGFAYMFSGKYDRAINAFNSAYSVDRTYFPALYNIAAIYDLMGQVQKARQFYVRYNNELHKGEDEF